MPTRPVPPPLTTWDYSLVNEVKQHISRPLVVQEEGRNRNKLNFAVKCSLSYRKSRNLLVVLIWPNGNFYSCIFNLLLKNIWHFKETTVPLLPTLVPHPRCILAWNGCSQPFPSSACSIYPHRFPLSHLLNISCIDWAGASQGHFLRVYGDWLCRPGICN